jgi:MOSC domain-containing protein YiiM
MLTAEDFETRWLAAEPAPRGSGTVELICVRVGGGVHEAPASVEVTVEEGVAGDRWSRGKRPSVDAQVTLMNVRVARLVNQDGLPLDAPGDNFFVDLDLAEESLPVGTRLRIGTALLEVSPAPHTGCKTFRERFGLDALTWVNDRGERRLRGMNCRVLEAGTVAVGDVVAAV